MIGDVEYLQVDETGRIELSPTLWRQILRASGVRSKKRRIQKKAIKRTFMTLLERGLADATKAK